MSEPAESDDDDIPGEDIVPILRGPRGAPVLDALIGCRFYQDDPDMMWEVTACDIHSCRLVLRRDDGSTRLLHLASGYVLMTPQLREALVSGQTASMRMEQAKRREVAAFGFTASIERDDLDLLCTAVRSAKSRILPSPEERPVMLAIAEKYGSAKPIIKLTSAWLDAAEGHVLPDILIRLVASLRHAGRSSEALERTEILRQPGLRMTDSQRGILFTERAALLADRYEQTRDYRFLQEARKCAARSWAIGPSEHCSRVYQRIDMLEKG